MIYLAIALVIGYGFGCLQSAYVVGRVFGKIDIREHGSGNAGMTNVSRVLGVKLGAFVLVFDAIKAIVAMMLVTYIFYGQVWPYVPYAAAIVAGLGVVLGHCFPFYLKFKGGKGVASALGLVIYFDWRVLAICLSIGLVSVILTRYISLASLASVIALFITTTIFYHNEPVIMFAMWVVVAIILVRHRANIKRLISGNENKFRFKR